MQICKILLVILFCGCSRAAVVDETGVSMLVESKVGKSVSWNRLQGDHVPVRCKREELTMDEAVEMALLNNPELQAILWELGIAQADLIEAGMLQNPLFDGYVRFPDRGAFHVNPLFSITQNFIDLLLIPLRKRVVEAELQKTQFRLAQAVLDLAFDVQETFVHLQAEQGRIKLLEMWADAVEAASQLAEGQKQQGNISELDASRRKIELLEAKAELSRNRVALIQWRERMNRLLGLSGGWRIGGNLPDLPKEEGSMDCLEALALSQRLDLEEARWDLESFARKLGVKPWWAYTAGVVGFSMEREPEGETVAGPAFSGAIPIFNYGQAERARLWARYSQSVERLKAMEIKALAEVRAASDQLLVSRQLAELYQKELAPLQKQVVELSQKYYHAMALSVYELLAAKRQELQLQIQGAQALRDYWLSRIVLDRATGVKR